MARQLGRVRRPSIVSESWLNYEDPKDPVAADIHPRNDYRGNSLGVRVVDDLVANDYLAPPRPLLTGRKANRHKSYGYLGAPELSRHVIAFLTRST